LQAVATQLWTAGQPFVQAEITVGENVPILGGSLEQALTDIGAGMSTVAGAWISKLSQTTTADSPKPADSTVVKA
jgi:hypothetical protein